MPKVSVILASCNEARYIREAIESVLDQTMSDLELLIIDDASTDESWWIIDSYSDPRIKTFRTTKRGEITSKAMECIFHVATGEYIAIHHSDDIWERDKLEKQVRVLNGFPDVGAVFTDARPIIEDGSALLDTENFYFNIFNQPARNRQEWLRHFFLIGNALCHPSALIRKSCFEECGFYRTWLWQLVDFEMWVRLALKYEIHVIPEKLTRFRVRVGGQEVQVSGGSREGRIRSAYEFFRLLDNYRNIGSFDDLYRVFPEARRYHRTEGADLCFVLGLVMLELATVPMARLFALDLLQEAVSDPVRGDNIRVTYGFGPTELIALTGNHDVFSLEELAALRAAVQHRDAQADELQRVIAQAAGQLAVQLEGLRDAWDSSEQVSGGGNTLSVPHPSDDTSVSLGDVISIYALASQKIHPETLELFMTGAQLPLRIHGRAFSVHINVYNNEIELLRAVGSAKGSYLAVSTRTGLVWDRHLLDRVALEIAEVDKTGVGWLCLSADGADHTGRSYVSAHFAQEPSLNPDRGRRPIVQSSGSLCVLKVAECQATGLFQSTLSELTGYLNTLILLGYARGRGSYFTSYLYPCMEERRRLSYQSLDGLIATLGAGAALSPGNVSALFPSEVPRSEVVAKWVEGVQASLLVRHRLSFVIRTLFRRQHLLRRGLISIEYLRRCLDLDVEIVLATDVDAGLAEREIVKLQDEFPQLAFVLALSQGERGKSRVRNLIAGLKATTGSRVAIIDDDDYYTPQAVACFRQACRFGDEALVIFGTQIVAEKWISASKKWHRELLAYEFRFDAKDWLSTLRGSNSIPLCGIIHPGWFIRDVSSQYIYDFDLSEDFIFHIMCFTHPRRPPIEVIDGVFAYQSHRNGDDNVSNVEDRTQWVSDTGNGLYQLLFEQKRNLDGMMASTGAPNVADAASRIEALETELSQARESLARAEAARLQAAREVARVVSSQTTRNGKAGVLRKLFYTARARLRRI